MKNIEIIEKRQSTRVYDNKPLSKQQIMELGNYVASAKRLVDDIGLNLMVAPADAAKSLEGVVGYSGNVFNAAAYFILLSDKKDYYLENTGFVAEALILKATELGLDTCFITVTDSDDAKKAIGLNVSQEVAAIIACGYGKKEKSFFRLDIQSPSNVNMKKREGHIAPKIAQDELVYQDAWGKYMDWSEGMQDPMIDEAFFAASLAPSFLNRQPYRYIYTGSEVYIFTKTEETTILEDEKLGLGASMYNFYSIYAEYKKNPNDWTMCEDNVDLGQPQEYKLVAKIKI